jgi:hypothetical protein
MLSSRMMMQRKRGWTIPSRRCARSNRRVLGLLWVCVLALHGCARTPPAEAPTPPPEVAPDPERHSYMPPGGYVPDAATAAALAEVVLVRVYGRAQIDGQKPLHAVLRDSTWVVSGQLPAGMRGGVALVEIDRRTGAIQRMSHGR